jgi:hypothetical protein
MSSIHLAQDKIKWNILVKVVTFLSSRIGREHLNKIGDYNFVKKDVLQEVTSLARAYSCLSDVQ